MNLNLWLRKTPQPRAVLCQTPRGESRVEVGGGGRAWRDLVKTIEGLEAHKVTALDGQGSVLRVLDLEPAEADELEPIKPTKPESELETFARLIAAAYERASVANQPLINNALQFVESLSQRLTKAETEIERLRQHNHRLVNQINELQLEPVTVESGNDGLLPALLNGLAAGQQTNVRPMPKKEAAK